jgi:hypothetical protein
MRRSARIAVGALAVVGLAAILMTLFVQFAVDCSGQRISSAASPSGKRVAEHHQTVCRSDSVPKTQIHLVQNGARVSTEIGTSTTNRIGLAWKDEDSLLISVPPGLDNAFDRKMQGVDLEFQVVSDETLLTPNKTMEPTR